MHLRSLTLQALGPFVGRHTIDFEQLGASGLYLLEGPTGVGKSTLIDAIVFALYGKVASAEASDDRLRSGFADEDTETFVDLVFETGSGAYRVRRSPEWLRAKKRGSGTTKQQATVKLWRLAGPDAAAADPDAAPADPAAGAVDPDGELMSTRLDEAGLEIQHAIGLDRTQFVQTIVLPQGEFASFLRADPEKRRGLLQKVFATGVYERVQDQLVAMRIEAQRAVAAAQTRVGAAAAQFVGAAGITDLPPELSDVARSTGRAGTDNLAGSELSDVARSTGRPGTDTLVVEGAGGLVGAGELRALGDTASAGLLPAVLAHVDALAAVAGEARVLEDAAAADLVLARAACDEAKALAD
ncbi:SMC family ATPase, partial [Pengzhenrongella sp.]|uniref:SMC family ATPase n=1 Tax=Pengzhenrongella sp. TaxID=2888820 RepID=UPI002F93FD0B